MFYEIDKEIKETELENVDRSKFTVDIVDEDESTINSFLKAIRKFKASKLSEEKIICYFIEALLSEGNKIAEELRNNLTDMEEAIVNKTVTEEFNTDLLCLKKKILKYYHCHNLFPAYDYRRLVWNEFPKYA